MRGYRKLVALPLILAVVGLTHPGSAQGQANALSEEANARFGNATQRTVCEEPNADQGGEAALRPICLRDLLGTRKVAMRNAIVIGFVGGFARRDDAEHPEVLFAALLRQHYPSAVHAKVFASHDGRNALRLSLVQVASSEICRLEKQEAKFHPMHMDWVLVADKKGDSQPRMRWLVD